MCWEALNFSGTGPTSAPTGVSAVNYAITYLDGLLTINPATPTPPAPVIPEAEPAPVVVPTEESVTPVAFAQTQLFDNLLFDQIAQSPRGEIESFSPNIGVMLLNPKFLKGSKGGPTITLAGGQVSGMPKFLVEGQRLPQEPEN